MSNTTKGAKAAAAPAPQPETNVKPINEAIRKAEEQQKAFQTLTERLNQRALLLKHINKLESCKSDSNLPEILEDPENLDRDEIAKITLNFSNDRYANYEIVNSRLVLEVTEFIRTRLASRITELEGEISQIAI